MSAGVEYSVPEYPKIYSPWKRHTAGEKRNQLAVRSWSSDALQHLADNEFWWTEKIDGTNIRVHWNGHTVTILGRTANAQLHPDLLKTLQTMFPEELLEDTWKDKTVTLFGEGYGAGIQKGGHYRPDKSFILFDVYTNYWASPGSVVAIGDTMGVEVVPAAGVGTIADACRWVLEDASNWEGAPLEGFVGVPMGGYLDRFGGRIAVKVKKKDMEPISDDIYEIYELC